MAKTSLVAQINAKNFVPAKATVNAILQTKLRDAIKSEYRSVAAEIFGKVNEASLPGWPKKENACSYCKGWGATGKEEDAVGDDTCPKCQGSGTNDSKSKRVNEAADPDDKYVVRKIHNGFYVVFDVTKPKDPYVFSASNAAAARAYADKHNEYAAWDRLQDHDDYWALGESVKEATDDKKSDKVCKTCHGYGENTDDEPCPDCNDGDPKTFSGKSKAAGK